MITPLYLVDPLDKYSTHMYLREKTINKPAFFENTKLNLVFVIIPNKTLCLSK